MIRTAAGTVLLILAAAAATAAIAAAPAPTTFPVRQGAPFSQPRELVSRHGVLRATLRVEETRFLVGGTRVLGKGYDGAFAGPTMRVRPGDTIDLRLVNRLAEDTNIHFHGFHVSPAGIADNVLRVMPKNKTSRVVVHIPPNLVPGTYWYHSHSHPHSEEQVFNGLSGAIIVEGLERRLPARLAGITSRVFAFKDLQVVDGKIPVSNINSDAPTTRTVNGLVNPRVSIRPGETQLWRLANIGADIWYRVKLPGVTFHVIGEDANPVGRVWSAGELVMPPGKRYDVLVRGPRKGTYTLRTLRFGTGPTGDSYPERPLATVSSAGAARPAAALPTSLGPLPSLGRAHVDRRRSLVFSENTKTSRFFINGKEFDHHHVDQFVRLGDTEEWTIRNTSRELHPFHIHVDDFQVMSINGRRYNARSLQDTIPLPYGGRVVIRMHFTDYTGRFVYHCHILNHEDHGMMGLVEVRRN